MKTITTNMINAHALTGLPYDGPQPRQRRIKRAAIGMPETALPTDAINGYGTTWQDMANEYARSEGGAQ